MRHKVEEALARWWNAAHQGTDVGGALWGALTRYRRDAGDEDSASELDASLGTADLVICQTAASATVRSGVRMAIASGDAFRAPIDQIAEGIAVALLWTEVCSTALGTWREGVRPIIQNKPCPALQADISSRTRLFSS